MAIEIKLKCDQPSETSKEFLQGMIARSDVSFYKYGEIAVGAPKLNLIQCAINCTRKYASTGNTEYLIDAANYLMFEFKHPKHPQAHFTPTDDSGSAHRIAADTGRPDARDNTNIGKRHGE